MMEKNGTSICGMLDHIMDALAFLLLLRVPFRAAHNSARHFLFRSFCRRCRASRRLTRLSRGTASRSNINQAGKVGNVFLRHLHKRSSISLVRMEGRRILLLLLLLFLKTA